MMCGRAVCIVLDGDTVMEHSNLEKWVTGLDSTDLQTYDTWVVEEGSTVFLPAGSVPIWIGISPDQKYEPEMKMNAPLPSGAVQRHAFAIAVNPIFDANFCKEVYREDICQGTVAQWVKSSSQLPFTWKTDARVKAWKEGMELATDTAPAIKSEGSPSA